jgi:heme oxygenase
MSDTQHLTTASTRLKVGTQDLHDQLDHQSAMRRLLAPDLSLAEYADLLRRMGSCYEVIEAAMDVYINAQGVPSALLNTAVFRRSRDIALDLQALDAVVSEQGRANAELTAPEPAQRGPALAITNLPEAAGCMYVLGGASMGARVISRALRMHLGERVAPALHFFGAGNHAGAPHFADLRIALDATLATPEDMDAAVAKARQVFGLFIDKFGR